MKCCMVMMFCIQVTLHEVLHGNDVLHSGETL